MKRSALVWDASKLDAFLAGPAQLVPGTSMIIMAPTAQERADVIAYLRTLTPTKP